MELADTSAWTSRHLDQSVAADFDERLVRGEIATCDMVRLELLWTTRDADELVARRAALAALHDCPIERPAWSRAIDVFERLAAQGSLHHRRVKLPDLMIAAAAELAGLCICHYDSNFEAIAAVTGQEVRAIAPLGSL